jgi:uncharacterized protein (DUF305 family)
MNRISILTAAALATVAVMLAAWPTSAQVDAGAMHSGHMSAASTAYMDAMTKMDEDMAAMPMTGEPGIDFALMMIPHHQSAIDMATAYLASGENDPELAKLSSDIIAAQETEIAFLRSWLQKKGH